MEYEMKIKKLANIIKKSKNIVFFTGAGVSTESNIPDFRSSGGLYKENNKYPYRPEEMISHSFWKNHTKMFYEYYFENMVYKDAKPNQAHLAIAELEKMGKVKAVVTQNIDGLHQSAGSEKVIEIHGSIKRNNCIKCGQFYNSDEILNKDNQIPLCKKCKGIIKPDVVLYEEALNEKVIKQALKAIINADTLVIVGTSLVVYPAAGFVDYFDGDNLVLINKSPTTYDKRAELCIYDKAGIVMNDVMKILLNKR